MHAKSIGIENEVIRDIGHEHMKCECDSMLKFITKILSFDTTCFKHEGAEIALTLDGSRFTSHAAHVACGVKVSEIRGRDPKRRDLLLHFQSREYSYAFEMHVTKDAKGGHECFKEFFAWGEYISEKGTPACSSYDEIKK